MIVNTVYYHDIKLIIYCMYLPYSGLFFPRGKFTEFSQISSQLILIINIAMLRQLNNYKNELMILTDYWVSVSSYIANNYSTAWVAYNIESSYIPYLSTVVWYNNPNKSKSHLQMLVHIKFFWCLPFKSLGAVEAVNLTVCLFSSLKQRSP